MKRGMKQVKIGPDRAKCTVRLPRELLAQVDSISQERGYTLNWALNAAARAFVAMCQAEGEARAEG